MSKKDFNQFRFAGLRQHGDTNKYYVMDRVSDDESKIIVAVGTDHLIKTKFGYALILDATHVIFVKEWAVDKNWFNNEVLLTKDFFNVKQWGDHYLFSDNDDALCFDYWLNAAKEQQEADNLAKWRK